MESFYEKLEQIEGRHDELVLLMAKPEVASDYDAFQRLAKEIATLNETVTLYRQLKDAKSEQKGNYSLIVAEEEAEIIALAKEEAKVLDSQVGTLEDLLKLALLPKDPNDDKNVIVEIRKGTGGDEAANFAGDLFRMYSRYAQLKGWLVEVLDSHESSVEGFSEIVFSVKGKGVFSRLKFERGVHRVQRVPTTEASGRIHTSTSTVAVLPEAEEVDVRIHPDDLRIDVFHSGGAGGQNVNKVATAIRIVHNPSGIIVTCQEERSQHKNKSKAMEILRARLYQQEQSKHQQEISASRKAQVGSAERAEKIRTYNIPQDRVTDHRIGKSFFGIPKILDGNIDELVDMLVANEQEIILGEALIV
jgi:peptide chain release factor 1